MNDPRTLFLQLRRALLLLPLLSTAAWAVAAEHPPRNPYLADSYYPLGHSNAAQVDSTPVPGPTSPSRALADHEIESALTGPGHLGMFVSGRYASGRRVIWTNGPHDIVKLDAENLRILSRFELPGYRRFTQADADHISDRLQRYGRWRRLYFGLTHIRRMLPSDLSSVYCLLDRDGRFYVGGSDGLTVYADAVAGDADAPIARQGTFRLPAEVSGSLVGINMTYDGWIVLATDAGYVLTVSRDLAQYRVLALPHRDEAAAYNARMADERRTGYNWIRNAMAVDDAGGIYVAANDWMMKVVWNGERLSADPADGGWAERYANGTGTGTGSTPVLLGFGDDDRLVAFTDGEALMNLTLMWRDAIPAGWVSPVAASPRVAARLPVTLGDRRRTALQSEQAVVAAGYGMVVVNNEPASMPFFLPTRAKGLLISLLADDPAYTPHGMEKFRWNPARRTLVSEWVNTQVSSPNCVPYISTGSRRVYTVGVVDGRWALQTVDFDSGRSAETYELGGPRFNTMFSGVVVDDSGRVTFGGMFGPIRLSPGAALPQGSTQ